MNSTSQRIIRNVKLLMVVTETRQADLAEQCGFSNSQMSRLLSGQRSWSLDHLEAIATAFGVSVSDLLAEADDLLRSRCFSHEIDRLETFANDGASVAA
jgi:transcriptional regulator with XRE-family HTH domain